MSTSTTVSPCLSKAEKQLAVLDTSSTFSFYRRALWSAHQSTRRLPDRRGRGGVWGAGWQGRHCTAPGPHSGGNTTTCLLLCLPKGEGRSGFGVAACSCLPCFHLRDGDTETSAGAPSCHFPPPPNLYTKSGLLLLQQHFPSKASRGDGDGGA